MQRFFPLMILFVFASFSAVALACNVPVFRYALERWAADPYEIVVLHEGDMEPTQVEQLTRLREASRQVSGNLNCLVKAHDVQEGNDRFLQQLWEEEKTPDGKPLLVVLYPRNAREVPDRLVFARPLSEQAVLQLIDSPVRQKVTDNLLSGDSAVWIFVPSGDKEQDDLAYATLKDQAKKKPGQPQATASG